MNFRRYDHLERLAHGDVLGIAMGTVHVFPKLDGTNASLWTDEEGTFQCGSRNRTLSTEADNAGFYAWANSDDPVASKLRLLCTENPDWVVYGEWLVPHTLKTYREDVWRKFWVFDVYDRESDSYMPVDRYAGLLIPAGINYIEPLCTIKNPSIEQLQQQVETNTYLIADGAGLGEGVVIKNYDWKNSHGRQPWAKVVRNSFKEENRRAFGVAEKEGQFQVEVAIVEEFVTPHLVGKTHAKVLLDVANENEIDTAEPNWQARVQDTFRGRVIPQLLSRVYHDLITEEMWAILKKHKNCKIDFKLLNSRTIHATKQLTPDLFS